MVVEAVREHYVVRWGEPSRTASFKIRDYEIQVLKWGANRTEEGVNLYATLGASSWPMPAWPAGHLVEYILGFLPAQDEIASPLAALGLYAQREAVTIDHGHTVPAGGPLWPGTEMRTFLVLRQSTEVLPALGLPNHSHVKFLQAVPIFDIERRYKSERGVEALMRLWETKGLRFRDPNRSPEPPTSWTATSRP